MQRNIPMLPRKFSENLCSLLPGRDRFAFSVIFKMNAEAQIVGDVWFGKTVWAISKSLTVLTCDR